MSQLHGAHAIETKDGKLVALLILPMALELMTGMLDAAAKVEPGLMVREARNYLIVSKAERRDA